MAKIKSKGSDGNGTRRIVAYVVLGFLTVLCLVWFLLLFITTTKNTAELNGVFKFSLGSDFFNNFNSSIKMQNIFRGLLNSFIVSGSCAVLSVYFSTVTAYAIHAYDFRFRGAIFTFILAIMMIPSQVTVLGFVELLRKLNITENYAGLIIPSIAAPVTFYYIKQYMESVLPMALIEAARIDGSGELRTFNSIVLPLMKPAIAVQAIFTFVSNWNNFFIPSQVIVTNKHLKTVALMIADLRAADFRTFDMGQLYMTIMLAIFPVVLVYLICSKYIVGGVALGSVKG